MAMRSAWMKKGEGCSRSAASKAGLGAVLTSGQDGLLGSRAGGHSGRGGEGTSCRWGLWAPDRDNADPCCGAFCVLQRPAGLRSGKGRMGAWVREMVVQPQGVGTQGSGEGETQPSQMTCATRAARQSAAAPLAAGPACAWAARRAPRPPPAPPAPRRASTAPAPSAEMLFGPLVRTPTMARSKPLGPLFYFCPSSSACIPPSPFPIHVHERACPVHTLWC